MWYQSRSYDIIIPTLPDLSTPLHDKDRLAILASTTKDLAFDTHIPSQCAALPPPSDSQSLLRSDYGCRK